MPAVQCCWEVCIQLSGSNRPVPPRAAPRPASSPDGLALALLVARIRADHHDPPMPTDHPALVADRLDARVHLHGCFDPVLSTRRLLARALTCSGTQCGHGTGRRETTPPPPGPRAGCGCSAAASCR